MSEVFIPLGGAAGKNRGEGVQVDENYTYLKLGNSGVGIPLPAGNYKALKAVHGEENPFSSYGDGKNAAVFMTKDFLKKVTLDLFGIASITNFSLTMYAHRQVRLTWAKPSQGLWSGVRFVFKYGSMPTSETDGFMFYDSADVHYETPKLEERELFVRAYSYVTVKDGRWYDEGAVSARITVSGISGSVTLSTGAGTWTVPDKVKRIRYILVGHGGNGGVGNSNYTGTGGGGGGYFTTGYLNVTPGQQINWVVPSSQGAPTSFAGIVANSGTNGNDSINMRKVVYGGNGGSGGGAGQGDYHPGHIGGDGGVNGGDGGQAMYYQHNTKPYGYIAYPAKDNTAGIGQHTSTTGFNGVLYSGGGSGGGSLKTVQEGGGGLSVASYSAPRSRHNTPGNPEEYAKACGVNGLGGGGGGYKMSSYGGGYIDYSYETRDGEFLASQGGTGCIYIAWGSAMNDGT